MFNHISQKINTDIKESLQTNRYGQHTTDSLFTDNPVDMDIKLISVARVDSPLDPKGEMIIFHVVHNLEQWLQ